MHTLSRELLFPHRPGRAPVCGFVAYVSDTRPILLRRMGWEIGDDVHDDFTDSLSFDNGQTWTEPRVSLRGRDVDGPPSGFEFFIESAALLCPDRGVLLTFTDRGFTPSKDHHTFNQSMRVRVSVLDAAGIRGATGAADLPPASGEFLLPLLSDHLTDFGLPEGVAVSFCNPLRDSRGRVLVPVQWPTRDDDGRLRSQGFKNRTDMPGVMADYGSASLLIGEFNPKGGGDPRTLIWRLGGAVPLADGLSSRGMYEPTVAELPDGRLALVLRGSNHAWPDRPGYKWLSISNDGGDSWSPARPLACDDGSLIESSATGSTLLRSFRSGKLYWVGNLCIDGERPNGNMPRSPLVIAEVREDPFALKRDTITVIDRRSPHEDNRVQLSNFKCYQDRETGDLCLSLTRYGERGSANGNWINADHYGYRVKIDA